MSGCRVIPVPRREGDHHFADRSEHAIYLGPSEVSPGHVVYLLSSRRITTVAGDRQARTLSMSQELYVVDLITKYSSFLDATVTRTFDTPMEEGLVLSAADQPEVGSEAADGLIPGHGHRWRRTGRHGGHEIVKPFVYREPQVAAKTRDQVFVVQQLPRATEARGAVRAITPGVSSAF